MRTRGFTLVLRVEVFGGEGGEGGEEDGLTIVKLKLKLWEEGWYCLWGCGGGKGRCFGLFVFGCMVG